MFHRSVIIVCLFVSFSCAEQPTWQAADLGACARFARVATDFTIFDLSSDQLDALLDNQAKHTPFHSGYVHSDAGFARPTSDAAYLDGIYRVLNESQELRFHQVLMQKWMNEGDLEAPLTYFAHSKIEDLDAKLGKLEKEIVVQLYGVIAAVEKARANYEPNTEQLLANFVIWRWKRQTDWLTAELGERKCRSLIGEPVPQKFQFEMPNADPVDEFDDVSYYRVGPMNAATGERVVVDRRNKPKRPVDVPAGFTLDQAIAMMQDVEERYLAKQAAYEDRMAVARASGYRDSGPMRFRASYVWQNDYRQLKNEMEKAALITEKLGGEPYADYERVRAARRAFIHGHFICNSSDFLHHIEATAVQCDRLHEVWDKHAVDGRPGDEDAAYIHDVLRVLDAGQQRKLKQLLFRRYWWSPRCDAAFAFTQIVLTSEQEHAVEELRDRLKRAIKEVGATSSKAHKPFHFTETARLKPFLQLHDDFSQTLKEIAGEANVGALQGEPVKYVRHWKRPVVAPEGVTLEQAKATRRMLMEELAQMVREHDLLDGVGGGTAEAAAKRRKEQTLLRRRVTTAARIAAELAD